MSLFIYIVLSIVFQFFGGWVFIVKAHYDVTDDINKNIYVPHALETGIIAIVLISVSVLLFSFSPWLFANLLVLGGWGWPFFNRYMNSIRGLSLDYLSEGEIGHKAAFSDRFLLMFGQKNENVVYFITFLIMVGLSVLSFRYFDKLLDLLHHIKYYL